ncbi:MAG: peptidoglycan-binding domain-containing protein [Candidatus Omnitrophota bacterium]
MKRLLGLMVVVLVLAGLSGCGKKQEAEELQPITMESLGAANSLSVATADTKAPVVEAASVPAAKEVLPLPPQGPYKPTGIEIQTALKNAGFYTGSVDGKVGPKSKKAIEDFQSANGLKADGKVGPKTWEALAKHLTAAPVSAKR